MAALDIILTEEIALSKQAFYNSPQYNAMQYNQNVVQDIATKDAETFLSDNLFIGDVVTKQITEKILAETIPLAIWLIDNKRPAQLDWSDQ